MAERSPGTVVSVNFGQDGSGGSARPAGGSIMYGGGSGGGGESMEQRVTRLEVQFEQTSGLLKEIRDDLKDVRSRLDRMEVKVDERPTKWWMVVAIGVMLTTFVAILRLDFIVAALTAAP